MTPRDEAPAAERDVLLGTLELPAAPASTDSEVQLPGSCRKHRLRNGSIGCTSPREASTRRVGKELDPRVLLERDTGVVVPWRPIPPVLEQVGEALGRGDDMVDDPLTLQDGDVRPSENAFSCTACRLCAKESSAKGGEVKQPPPTQQPVLILGLAYDPPVAYTATHTIERSLSQGRRSLFRELAL
mmetsp:Transcript_85982/g.266250  ORF Transcript_85982/g.266250 Transcript_85982/m.266250 type:complete len:186 (-) Transcript_85982:75-632(-)